VFEIGFWILWMHEKLLAVCNSGGGCDLRAWIPRRSRRQEDSLYTHAQVRDALNMFLVLTILCSDLADPLCLNRMGNNPLEHTFRRACIRCRDVNTMERVIAGFNGDFMPHPTESFLQLGATLRPRLLVGSNCLPLLPCESSIFPSRPHTIALSLLARSARSPTPRVNPSGFRMFWLRDMSFSVCRGLPTQCYLMTLFCPSQRSLRILSNYHQIRSFLV
jgi:hypothetical protein